MSNLNKAYKFEDYTPWDKFATFEEILQKIQVDPSDVAYIDLEDSKGKVKKIQSGEKIKTDKWIIFNPVSNETNG